MKKYGGPSLQSMFDTRRKVKKQKTEKKNPTSSNILPCPFCGSTNISVVPKMYNGGAVEIRGSKFWRVECLPCYARTGDNFDDDAKLSGFKDGREMAIEAWNMRTK